MPKSRGGETTLDNLALSCQGCNNHKYNKIQGCDSVSGETVSLYHPRQELWNDNFAWNNDFTLVIGLTPTRRATVETLKLNREGVVKLIPQYTFLILSCGIAIAIQ
ncbi:MAG: HNH endonuclease [Rivularia sp. (in: cyanobacteria)]